MGINFPSINQLSNLGLGMTAIEFEDMTTAENFYNSEDYTAAKTIRLLAAETDLILAEGL